MLRMIYLVKIDREAARDLVERIVEANQGQGAMQPEVCGPMILRDLAGTRRENDVGFLSDQQSLDRRGDRLDVVPQLAVGKGQVLGPGHPEDLEREVTLLETPAGVCRPVGDRFTPPGPVGEKQNPHHGAGLDGAHHRTTAAEDFGVVVRSDHQDAGRREIAGSADRGDQVTVHWRSRS